MEEIDLHLTPPKNVNWSFHGTCGKMKLKTTKNNPMSWKSQIFAYSVDADKFDEFECGGNFTGFACCKNFIKRGRRKSSWTGKSFIIHMIGCKTGFIFLIFNST